MDISTFDITGPLLIKPPIFRDPRGYFSESYNQQKFKAATGIEVNFVQDNESQSNKGALRGLHFQRPPYAQAKLVRVVRGAVLDVIVDIRESSPTIGQYISLILSEANKNQLFVPRGFAHGFLVLEDHTIFSYKVDNYYSREHDTGIKWDDRDINIDWKSNEDELILSDKDKTLQTLKEYLVNPDFKL